MTSHFDFRRIALVMTALVLAAAITVGCSQSPEARSAKFIAKGKELLQKNDVSRALIQFRNAVKATPKDADAYYELSVALLRGGDLRNGVLALRQTLELNPHHQAAQLRLAELMASTQDPALLKEAQKRLGEVLADSAQDPEALQALATTELKLGAPGDAVQHLEQAIAAAPHEMTLALTLAHAKLQQQDVKGAEDVLRKLGDSDPKSAEAATFLGEFLISQGRAAEAEGQFQRAMANNPSYAPAVADLAMFQNSAGRNQEAEQTFRRLSRLNDKRYQHFYAVFLFQSGRNDEALKEFERLTATDPDDRAARTRLVAAYNTLKRPKDAERVLRTALEKNPKDQDALLQRSELFMEQGKFAEAEADINSVLHQSPNSGEAQYILAKFHQARGQVRSYRADLAKALQLSPYMLNVRVELAQSLVAGQDPKGAVDLLDQAPQFQREMTPLLLERNWALLAEGDMTSFRKGIGEALSKERSPVALLQDAIYKLRDGKISAAQAAAEECLKLNPSEVRALDVVNQAFVAEKQPAAGVQKLREYAAQHPKSAAIQQFVGVVLLAHGDKVGSRALFLAAKAADPSDWKADHSLVEVDFLDKKWDQAEDRLKAILAANPRDSKARLWLGHVDLIKGNKQAALAEYRRVADENANDADALNNVAYLLGEAGQGDEALKYAQKAQELAPDNPDISDTVGWILYQKGLYPSAIQQLERAAVSKQANPVAGYHLAMAYAKAGDAKRARSTFENAYKEHPDLPEAKTANEIVGGQQ